MITLQKRGRWMFLESNTIDKRLDDKLNKVIDKTLSYEKKGSHFMTNPLWGIIHLYSIKQQKFPFGLLSKVISVLEEWRKQKNESYQIEIYESTPTFKVQTSNLRDYQIEALNKAIENKGGSIVIPVSGGKTKVGERILASYGPVDSLVVVPTKELKKQWEEECYGHLQFGLRVETFQKLYRELKDPIKLKVLKQQKVVILDECHKVAARTPYKIGMNCDNAHIYGLTGTPRREDNEDMKIEAVVGPIIYTVPIQKLTQEGYIVPARVHMIDIPKYQISPMDDYRSIYDKAIVNNDHRNYSIIRKAIELDDKVLILIDKIEHGQKLFDKFIEFGLVHKNNKKVCFVSGKTLSKKRDEVYKGIQNQEYDIIIASRILNEGINLPYLKNLIIASGGQSSIRVVQQIGRVLRIHKDKARAEIYDFNDSCKILKRHTKKRVGLYQENGFEVVDE